MFNRYEPVNPLSHAALLVVVPALLIRVLLSSFPSVVRVVSCTYLLYYATILVSILVYRLSPFHPLAEYPGPILCRVSKFWMAWVSSEGKQHKYYRDLHDKYGDVVRIGQSSFLYSSSLSDSANVRSKRIVFSQRGCNFPPHGMFWSPQRTAYGDVTCLVSTSTYSP